MEWGLIRKNIPFCFQMPNNYSTALEMISREGASVLYSLVKNIQPGKFCLL